MFYEGLLYSLSKYNYLYYTYNYQPTIANDKNTPSFCQKYSDHTFGSCKEMLVTQVIDSWTLLSFMIQIELIVMSDFIVRMKYIFDLKLRSLKLEIWS